MSIRLQAQSINNLLSEKFTKCCSPALFSKVLAARKIIFLAAHARKIKLARKDHSVPLLISDILSFHKENGFLFAQTKHKQGDKMQPAGMLLQ